ncbi:MAG: HipA N-terminal domain-containing protein [Janthinobacterium lividum]
MTASHSLYVATQGELVGKIDFQSREERFGFEYAPAWLKKPDAHSLSPKIPLDGPPADGGTIHRFLQNLLPEGRTLEIASIVNQVSKSNTFALIRLLGKEPVGALSFLALDETFAQPVDVVRDQARLPAIRNGLLNPRSRRRTPAPTD